MKSLYKNIIITILSIVVAIEPVVLFWPSETKGEAKETDLSRPLVDIPEMDGEQVKRAGNALRAKWTEDGTDLEYRKGRKNLETLLDVLEGK